MEARVVGVALILDFRLDAMKLPQIDRQQNDMQNNNRIDVREKTVENEQNIACESCHAKMSN